MSVENVVRFFGKLETDESLAGEYTQATRGSMQEALRSAVVELAARHGCEFTADDLETHLDRVAAELGDDELDRVAGGGVEPSPFMPIDPLKGQASHGRFLEQLLQPPGGAGWDPSDIGHR